MSCTQTSSFRHMFRRNMLGVPDPFPPFLSTPPLTQPSLQAGIGETCADERSGPLFVTSPRTSSKSAVSTRRSTSLRERTASKPPRHGTRLFSLQQLQTAGRQFSTNFGRNDGAGCSRFLGLLVDNVVYFPSISRGSARPHPYLPCHRNRSWRKGRVVI